jgi:hypothetical protein
LSFLLNLAIQASEGIRSIEIGGVGGTGADAGALQVPNRWQHRSRYLIGRRKQVEKHSEAKQPINMEGNAVRVTYEIVQATELRPRSSQGGVISAEGHGGERGAFSSVAVTLGLILVSMLPATFVRSCR